MGMHGSNFRKYLIYNITFWNNHLFKEQTKNYLSERDCALMFCSSKCIGEYISKLLNGEITDD